MKRRVESTSLFTGKSAEIQNAFENWRPVEIQFAFENWQDCDFEQLDSVALVFQAQAAAFEKRAKHVKDTTNLEADIEHLEAILDTRQDQQLILEAKTKQLENTIGETEGLVRALDLKVPRLQEALETAQQVYRMSKLVRDGAMDYTFSLETSSTSTQQDLASLLVQLQHATTIVQTYLKEETNLVIRFKCFC
jgi:chromosome segregation ATPase